MAKTLIGESLNLSNDWKWWERALGVGLGLILDPSHYIGEKLKEHGMDLSDCEVEPWDYR